MSELRFDITTREWVIISTERARRPREFAAREAALVETPRESCPFCPGHEKESPPELYREPQSTAWSVRVVPNKFPALSPGLTQPPCATPSQGGMFFQQAGVGHHEVIIESPQHSARLATMSSEEIADILHAYRSRYQDLRRDPAVRLIIIFKNSGEQAGTSLSHPHSQLIATPIVPLWIQTKHAVARQYWDQHQRCLYCDLLEAELQHKERVIFETQHFGVFQPFASRLPFETWIMPKRHAPSFGGLQDNELVDLANVIRTIFRLLERGLGPFPYNYVIHSAPAWEEDRRFYLWHLEILPRLTTIAGFEMGSRIFINTASPEETAAFLWQLASLDDLE